MVPHEFILGMRTILLASFALVFLVPEYALAIRRELFRLWHSIHAPFLLQKKAPKKGGRFWEIDMTDFEP